MASLAETVATSLMLEDSSALETHRRSEGKVESGWLAVFVGYVCASLEPILVLLCHPTNFARHKAILSAQTFAALRGPNTIHFRKKSELAERNL